MASEHPSLIPFPSHYLAGSGSFDLTADCSYSVDAPGLEGDRAVQYLRGQLQDRYGLILVEQPGRAKIRFRISADVAGLRSEAYRLDVSPEGVAIVAVDGAGLFYGVVTLLQMLHDVEGGDGLRSLPAASVVDAPRYEWRGMMLDVARYFFPVQFIKQFIDLMAMYKMNVFHWHLTEDQGWRIEIRKYPKLTEVGAWRAETLVGHLRDEPQTFDGVAHGGFYTQAQVREVVEYAASRCITVVPEIEMPGHCVAALAAYPELSCSGQPLDVSTKWGIHSDVYCAGKEETFEFLEDVLEEIVGLFPSRFVHIGGDECPKVRWRGHGLDQRRMRAEGLSSEEELQSYFIRRIEKSLMAENRRLIGWDEILEGGLAPEATVMSWRGFEGGVAAANAGHDVVMTPMAHCYFDYYQSNDRVAEPLAHGRVLSLDEVYGFEPTPPGIAEDMAHHVLGAQGNVWTEYMPSESRVEYMSFPRMSALAEVLWTPARNRGFAGFVKRLRAHLGRLDQLGVRYRFPDDPVP